jgi:hypothetical protein
MEGPGWGRVGGQVGIKKVEDVCLVVHTVHKLAERILCPSPRVSTHRERRDSSSHGIKSNLVLARSEGLDSDQQSHKEVDCAPAQNWSLECIPRQQGSVSMAPSRQTRSSPSDESLNIP